MITQKELKELLQYNENTGIFTWKISTNFKIKIGNIAGTLHKNGYIYIQIKNRLYMAHRLSWLYVYGEWPKNQIDHINGIRSDNRIENLRDVTQRENQQNYKKHRDGHLVGTTYNKQRQKWLAQITINKKPVYLGRYNTQQEAHEAYLKFLKEVVVKAIDSETLGESKTVTQFKCIPKKYKDK